MSRTLAVDLGGGLALPTPVMVAAGCGGTGRELGGFVDLKKVGGVVSRTITVLPEPGALPPRIVESASGIVWATGGQNPGIEGFLRNELPRLARSGVAVVVSVGGSGLEELARIGNLLRDRPGVSAIEVNLSGSGVEFGRETEVHVDRALELAASVSRVSTVPVFAKIPLHAPDLVEIAAGLVRAGVHGLTIGGPPSALAIDVELQRPALGALVGRLSGPAIRPLMLRAVFDVSTALPETPLLACGGIRSGDDAIEAMMAGAWAVQLGTATLIDPNAPVLVAQGIARYLKGHGLSTPRDVRARVRVPPLNGGTVDGGEANP